MFAVIEISKPLESLKFIPSSIGLDIEVFAAITARSSPDACPTPNIALPTNAIIVLTSAKSILIRPLLVINELIAETPSYNVLLIISLHSSKDVSIFATLNTFSLGTTIIVSRHFDNSSMPSLAIFILFVPSYFHGVVTTPTVSMPISFARFAITGAAPVPVPPPIQAVIKSILIPLR